MSELTFHTELELDAGVVSYVDPDVHIDHDCKMKVTEQDGHLTFRCLHGHFTFPFGELNFKERELDPDVERMVMGEME